MAGGERTIVLVIGGYGMGRWLQSDVSESGAGDRCCRVGTRQLRGSLLSVVGSLPDRCLGKVGLVKLIYPMPENI